MQSVSYAPAGPFRWKEIDGEWVVFCSASGALQVADTVTAVVLASVECSPASVDRLVSEVASATGAATTEELRAGMSVLLDELERIGMVQSRCP